MAGVPVESFRPNRILYMKRQSLSSSMNIFDMTPHINTPIPHSSSNDNKSFVKSVKKLAKSLSPTPVLVISKQNFWATRWVVSRAQQSSQTMVLAELKRPAFSSTNRVDFPPNSPHSSHTLTISPRSFFSRAESFILDSLPYRWAMDSKWNERNMSLHKGSINKESDREDNVCARCMQTSSASNGGAVILVDTTKIDEVIAVLTAWIVLKRLQDSHSHDGGSREWGGGGGGGDGGGGGGGNGGGG